MSEHPSFLGLMQAATRLTRAGDLGGATRTIQQALRGLSSVPETPAEGDVIEVQAHEVVDPGRAGSIRLGSAPPLPPSAGARAQAVHGAPRSGPQDVFIAGEHSAAGLSRDYKLYVPPAAAGGARPLVVMLHGCTQDPDDFAAGTGMNALAREQGFFVLYPAQSPRANPQRCWNWFKSNHQRRGRGEPALLASMTQEIVARHGIDARRVYVAGLSAGGAMAALLGEAYPDVFAAIGVHSGLPRGSAQDASSALQAMGRGASASAPDATLPTIVFHGDQDRTVHPRNGEQIAAGHAAAVPGAAEPVPGATGRASTRRVYRDAAGQVQAEHWVVHGGGHAWSGGRSDGSYTDPAGPDAAREMLRFFLEHPRAGQG
ncbi:extracellular catalytic domain type 1 short-chain-length polyhydroxyalkanoate depolymerase [Rubrivivax gelatinosus]|uniref:extracellular catalytic domain type 1 short-chain-length polyhydroxyalkanoate depolymerase n=1 Tax=Rubrivivax gelatinosus TaxID=28068 RepID=UPI001F5B98C9|nr:PHB depolymerase family esterase [Rubrivivax gelatinosus]